MKLRSLKPLWPTAKLKRRAWDLEMELWSLELLALATLLNYASPKAMPRAARSFVSHLLACWLEGEYCRANLCGQCVALRSRVSAGDRCTCFLAVLTFNLEVIAILALWILSMTSFPG